MAGRRIAAVLAVAALALGLAACSVPVDPEGTLDRVRGGVLRVGVTEREGWVSLTDRASPSGLEPDLMLEFAGDLDADVEWTAGSEQDLVDDLEHGRLDVAVGGFSDDTPWSDRVGMTRPYTEIRDENGTVVRHVVFTRMGENGLLFALDRFLLSKDVRP